MGNQLDDVYSGPSPPAVCYSQAPQAPLSALGSWCHCSPPSGLRGAIWPPCCPAVGPRAAPVLRARAVAASVHPHAHRLLMLWGLPLPSCPQSVFGPPALTNLPSAALRPALPSCPETLGLCPLLCLLASVSLFLLPYAATHWAISFLPSALTQPALPWLVRAVLSHSLPPFPARPCWRMWHLSFFQYQTYVWSPRPHHPHTQHAHMGYTCTYTCAHTHIRAQTS